MLITISFISILIMVIILPLLIAKGIQWYHNHPKGTENGYLYLIAILVLIILIIIVATPQRL